MQYVFIGWHHWAEMMIFAQTHLEPIMIHSIEFNHNLPWSTLAKKIRIYLYIYSLAHEDSQICQNTTSAMWYKMNVITQTQTNYLSLVRWTTAMNLGAQCSSEPKTNNEPINKNAWKWCVRDERAYRDDRATTDKLIKFSRTHSLHYINAINLAARSRCYLLRRAVSITCLFFGKCECHQSK